MRGRDPKNLEAGFTLLELLVALALLGFVSLLAIGLLRFAADGERRLLALETEIGDGIALERHLRREMNAVLPLLDYSAARPESSFSGDRNGFRFIAAGVDGPRRRAFVLVEDGSVVLSDGRFADAVVLFDAAAAGFSYFGRVAPEEMPVWHDDWSGALAPPRLVRLSRVREPDLVVPVPAERADQ